MIKQNYHGHGENPTFLFQNGTLLYVQLQEGKVMALLEKHTTEKVFWVLRIPGRSCGVKEGCVLAVNCLLEDLWKLLAPSKQAAAKVQVGPHSEWWFMERWLNIYWMREPWSNDLTFPSSWFQNAWAPQRWTRSPPVIFWAEIQTCGKSTFGYQAFLESYRNQCLSSKSTRMFRELTEIWSITYC